MPELVLRRAPYEIVVKELETPAFRQIGLVTRKGKAKPLAVERFIEYLPYRGGGAVRE